MANATIVAASDQISLLHIARSTVAAAASQLFAQAIHMPEPYWATVTTIVVMQSSLGAAWRASSQRLAGTIMGAVAGALMSTYLGTTLIVFGAAIAVTGALCLVLRLDRTAYRFAGITLTIVMLIQRNSPPWIIATRRCIEVSLGIAVALVLSAAWPEKAPSVASELT